MNPESLQVYLPMIAVLLGNIRILLKIFMDLESRAARRRKAKVILFRWYSHRASLLWKLYTHQMASVRCTLSIQQKPKRYRRWWRLPARQDWWENCLRIWDDNQWIEHFRMSRATLFEIADALQPVLQRQTTNMREPIPVVKRVALCIWRLANVCGYKLAAQQFGIGRTTAAVIVIEVCLAMEHLLLSHTVKLGDAGQIMDGFEKLGFPHCVGAVYCCNLPIVSQSKLADNQKKQFYSILLQGTTDHTGQFIHIEVDWSGKRNETYVFRNSALCETMDAGVFVPGNPIVTVHGVQVPPLIVADGAYPIRKWLMKTHEGNVMGRKAHFNQCLSRAHSVAECAFRRLKSRWRCLTATLEIAEENVVSVVTSCVILHNICEAKGHALYENIDPVGRIQLATLGAVFENEDRGYTEDGENVREAITELLWSLHVGHQ